MKIFRLLLAFIIPLIAIMATCESENTEGENKTPGVVVEEFYRLLQNEEIEKAAGMYSLNGYPLSAEETEKMESILSWAVEGHRMKGGIKEMIIIEETIIGDNKTAKVKYNMAYNNGDEDDKMQALEKIDGKWYMKTAPFYN